MDTNDKRLQYAKDDLFKAVLSLRDDVKDAIREISIYEDVYRDYLKAGGVMTEENERLKNRVSLIQDAIHHLKQELDW